MFMERNMKKIIKIVNIETNEEEIIERDETPAERLEREEAERLAAEIQENLAKKAEAKAALLERLGISEEEAKLLLG
jgi:ribosome assembly protein YihI (activator of Der GTPase)